LVSNLDRKEDTMTSQTSKKKRGGKLSNVDEKKLAAVAAGLAKTKKLDEQAVVTLGRKLIKHHKGLRSSKPPVPAKLKRTDVPTVVAALGLPVEPGSRKPLASSRTD
jgi:hypothetical protein